jgi:hypothetical protein
VKEDSLEAMCQGGSLEERLLATAGTDVETAHKLSWLDGGAS